MFTLNDNRTGKVIREFKTIKEAELHIAELEGTRDCVTVTDFELMLKGGILLNWYWIRSDDAPEYMITDASSAMFVAIEENKNLC